MDEGYGIYSVAMFQKSTSFARSSSFFFCLFAMFDSLFRENGEVDFWKVRSNSESVIGQEVLDFHLFTLLYSLFPKKAV